MYQALPYAHVRHIQRPALYTGSALGSLKALAALVLHYDPYVIDIRSSENTLLRQNKLGDPILPTLVDDWRNGLTAGGFTEPISTGEKGSSRDVLAQLGSSLILGPRTLGRTTKLSATVTHKSVYQALADLPDNAFDVYLQTVWGRLFAPEQARPKGPSRAASPVVSTTELLDPFTTVGMSGAGDLTLEKLFGDLVFVRAYADVVRSAYILKTPEDAVADALKRNFEMQAKIRGYRYLTSLIRAHAELRLFVIRQALRFVLVPDVEKQLVLIGQAERVERAKQFAAQSSHEWLNSIDTAFYQQQTGPNPWHQKGTKKLVERTLIHYIATNFDGSLFAAAAAAVANVHGLLRSLEIMRDPETVNVGAIEPTLRIGSGGNALGSIVLPFADDIRIIYTDGVRASQPTVAVADFMSATWLKSAAPTEGGGFETDHTGPIKVGTVENMNVAQAFPSAARLENPAIMYPSFESAMRLPVSMLSTPPTAIRRWSEYQGGLFSQLHWTTKDPIERFSALADWLGVTTAELEKDVLNHPENFEGIVEIGGTEKNRVFTVSPDIEDLYYGDLRIGSELTPIADPKFKWPRVFNGADRIYTMVQDQLFRDKAGFVTEQPSSDVVRNRAYPDVAYDMTPDIEGLMQQLLPSKLVDIVAGDLPTGGALNPKGPTTVDAPDQLIIGTTKK